MTTAVAAPDVGATRLERTRPLLCGVVARIACDCHTHLRMWCRNFSPLDLYFINLTRS